MSCHVITESDIWSWNVLSILKMSVEPVQRAILWVNVWCGGMPGSTERDILNCEVFIWEELGPCLVSNKIILIPSSIMSEQGLGVCSVQWGAWGWLVWDLITQQGDQPDTGQLLILTQPWEQWPWPTTPTQVRATKYFALRDSLLAVLCRQ